MNARRVTLAIILLCATSAYAGDFHYKDRLTPTFLKQLPDILKTYDGETGRFGTGIWICRDQDVMYPLAVAYARQMPGNKYYKDPALLEIIMKAGDALIEDADKNGQWVFRKKDGSTWGNIYMPWTYSRWIRSYALIRDDMPADRRAKWVKALTLGYEGIRKTQLKHVHNIPTHHAMGLYQAGLALDKPEWCKQAADFMMKVIGTQAEGGYFSEGGGPVVTYDFVYVDALGTYYAMSGDERVRPALAKAAVFHRHFTYPGGQSVETVDQRNPYHDRVNAGNVGFTFTPDGRSYLKSQWDAMGWEKVSADIIASLLLFGEEGGLPDTAKDTAKPLFVLNEGGIDRAAVLRQGPWFVCLSAYTTPLLENRWIQDRQNFVSIWHDKVELIIGGGNTKLQPAWSTFTVGDISLLKHKRGDTNPKFSPRGELYHIPSAAKLVREPDAGLELTYGSETCRASVRVVDERTVEYHLAATVDSGLPVAAHVTLMPTMKEKVETGGGQSFKLGEEPVNLTGEQVGGGITHAGWKIAVPAAASLHWPAKPHNPYRKDGRAEISEARLELRIPFDADHLEHKLTLTIVP